MGVKVTPPKEHKVTPPHCREVTPPNAGKLPPQKNSPFLGLSRTLPRRRNPSMVPSIGALAQREQ